MYDCKAPLSRFYYPDTRRIINAFIIIYLFISAAIRAARWSLFGHVLRLPLDAPVQRAIDAYLEDTGTPKFRGRPRCTLPITLGENLRRIGRQLHNSDDIDALRTLDRSTWRDLGRELA